MSLRVILQLIVLSFLFLTSACVNKSVDSSNKRYQRQLNQLSKSLKKQKKKNRELKDENIVLRQLVGVPEPAIQRVKRENKKSNKVFSEKFLYRQVVKSYNERNRDKLNRAVSTFLSHYPKSKKADNAIYYKALGLLKTGNYAESLTNFDMILEKYPKASKKPGAILGKGLAYKSLNLPNQAGIMFKELITKFPKAPESVRAKRELNSMEGI